MIHLLIYHKPCGNTYLPVRFFLFWNFCRRRIVSWKYALDWRTDRNLYLVGNAYCSYLYYQEKSKEISRPLYEPDIRQYTFALWHNRTVWGAFLNGARDGGNTVARWYGTRRRRKWCRRNRRSSRHMKREGRFKMRVEFVQLLSCITVIAILLSGCSDVQNGSNAETFIPPSSETTQAADNVYSSDMCSDTEDSLQIGRAHV